ncbi:MAG: TlpA disulfide reductase family protein [Candidatus Bathyarchaeia archaeon]|jgi:peroxiredoxin
MNTKTTAALMLTLIVGISAFAYWVTSNRSAPPGVNVGDQAVEMKLNDTSGQTFSLSTQRGKTVVLDFVTTTCSVCVEEFDALRQLQVQKGLVIVSVNVDGTSESDLLTFAKNNKVSWLIGNSPTAIDNYKVSAVPTLVVVDKSGTIRYRGFYTSYEQLIQIINANS